MYKQLWETNSYRVAARRKENPLDREPRELLVLFVRTSQGASWAGGIGGGRAACACGRWSDAVFVRPCTALLHVALLHYYHFFPVERRCFVCCAFSRRHQRLMVPAPNQTVSFNEMTKAVPWSGVRYPITERLRKIMSGQPPKTLRKRLQISTICLVNLIDMSPGLWIQPQRSLSRKMTLRSGTSTRKDHGGQHYL